MSSHDSPDTPDRPPSDAENAMAANARSRDRQGKAEDKARHDRAGLTGEGGAGEAHGPSVSPEARSISEARQGSRDDDRAADKGLGGGRSPSRGPNDRP